MAEHRESRKDSDMSVHVHQGAGAESTLIPEEGGTISRLKRVADYKVEDRGYDTPCWIWQRFVNQRGYGYVTLNGVSQLAHREYYRRATGADIKGLDVHHKCEVTVCVNPEHLETKDRVRHLADHKQEKSPLTWDDVRDIRRRAAEGALALGREYGFSHNYIGQIILNRYWVDPDYTPAPLERACLRPGCGQAFTAKTATSRFCTPYCRNLHNGRRATGYYERRGIAA